MIRCVEVALTIPDNEALTALATLQRLGVPVDALTRADLYRCEVEKVEQAVEREQADHDLLATLRRSERIFNPNKHRIALRTGHDPLAGEVWIDTLEGPNTLESCEPPTDVTMPGRLERRAAGHVLPGIRRLERSTAWRLFDRDGSPAAASVVAAAVETLLCNPAFQKATTT